MNNISDWFRFEDILYLIKVGWDDFVNIDFSRMGFEDINFALFIGGILLALVILRFCFILFGRRKFFRNDSGHLILNEEGHSKFSLIRFFMSFPIMALAVFLGLILTAIAKPFLPLFSEEKRYVETRVRIELRDVSGSMESKFKNTEKSKAEVAMDAHLKFLEMRFGNEDRTSFWIFSANPYLIQDFVVDEELYYLQVYDAPWELGSSNRDYYDWGDSSISHFPRSRYAHAEGEGGTILSQALQAVIKQFEQDEEAQKNSPNYKNAKRSLLIITDAAISDLEETKVEIAELSKRRVVIYMIFIDERAGEGNPDQLGSVNPLLKEVVSHGGGYFPVSDELSLMRAYRQIDSMEKVKVEITRRMFKDPIFEKFIFASILSLIIIIPLGFLFELFKIYP